MKAKLGVVTIKVETTYGTFSSPTTSSNVLVAYNMDLNPLEMTTDDYAPIGSSFGEGEKIVAAKWCTLTFDVPLCGSGAAGTAPNHAAALRACAIAEVLTASVSAAYSLISSGEESVSMEYIMDGVTQKMKGIRGTVETKWEAGKAPIMSFKVTGLNVPMTDQALPTETLPNVPRPVAVNVSNTTLVLGGYTARMSSLSMALNNDVQYRNLTNREDVIIVDRKPAGKCMVELPTVAEKDFLGAAGICTLGTAVQLQVVHGTTAGNIVTDTWPKVQLLKPKPKAQNGVVMLECDLHFARSTTPNSQWTRTYT